MLFCKKAVEEDLIEEYKKQIKFLNSVTDEQEKVIKGFKETIAERVIVSDEKNKLINKLITENDNLKENLKTFKNVGCKFILNKEINMISITRIYPINDIEHTIVCFMNADGDIVKSRYQITRNMHNNLCDGFGKETLKYLILQ